jgi:hypothetical protein
MAVQTGLRLHDIIVKTVMAYVPSDESGSL